MTAIEIVETVMGVTGTSMKELVEYADLGSMSNVMQMLNRSDLKVGTFVKMLETMGFQLIAQSTENDEEFIIDYDEG